MKRREFLLHAAGAAAAPVLAPVFSNALAHALPHAALPMPLSARSPLDRAAVIWSAASIPVPLLTGGGADAIASPLSATPDLHSVFAKQFTLSTLPAFALLHLFAFTRYRLYVNGAYAGRGPARYQNRRPAYDSRDIGSLLHLGPNTLVILVHRDAPTGRIMHHPPGLLAALALSHPDRTDILPTDASWLSMPELSFLSRVQAWASIQEHLDARNSFDWTQPDLASLPWQPSTVVSAPGALAFFPRDTPLQREAPIPWSPTTPAFPIDLSPGTPVSLPLTRIAQAYHLFHLEAEAGSHLELTYCLPGDADSGTSTYTARAGSQTWLGGDTFAFNRLQLTLTSGRLRITHASAFEVRYPFERVGAFTCSDPFLTRLWSICARSLEILSEDAYVDCADRERVEWTDNSPPAFDCTRLIMRGPDDQHGPHWGDARLLGSLLRRIALTQQPDGQLKAHSCSERFDIHAIMEDRSCDWVVLLRQYLDSSNDTALVRELWPVLRRLLTWFWTRRTSRGLVLAREWEVWDNPVRYQFCEGAGLNAMAYRAFADAAAMAATLGRPAAAHTLARQADQLRQSFHHLLWNEQEGVYDAALFGPGSQTRIQLDRPFTGTITNGRFHPTAQANLFALYSGIVPPHCVDRVRSWILAHRAEVVGPMSHYYLFHVLYAMADPEQDHAVLDLIRSGWRLQVESPWQTTWEELIDGGGSKVHIYGMHPASFLSAFVLGARRQGPASQRTILIEPRFSGLDFARGICVTEFGPVEMDWRLDSARRPRLTCVIPQSVQATLRLPALQPGESLRLDGSPAQLPPSTGPLEVPLGPGRHTIEVGP